uniref:185/333 D1 alpha n=1 Tax=Strongylocentrotus purpuratus TaxID=7668 RepID=Q3LS87_STRPU|nr:185/333 [Strongylocentrotus purpuratus]
MEVKVTLIVAIVAALAISAHAQSDFNERRGKENGRERGQRFDGPGFGAPPMGGPRQDGGPMGGRRFDGPGFGGSRPDGAGRKPFFVEGGRRGDGEQETDAAQQIGPGRFPGPGHGHYGHHQGAGRPFFGNPPPFNPEQEPRNDSSEEDGRHHLHHDRHHAHHGHHGHHEHHHQHHNHTEGHQDHDRPMFEMRPFRFNPLGRKPFGDHPFGRRNHTEGHQGHNETGDHPHRHHSKNVDGDQDTGHHGHHGHHEHHHHQHDHREGHQDHDRPMFEMRPFRFNPLGRKPFGDHPFGRRNHTEGHQGHNETGDHPHRHHSKTGDGDQDRPMFETRPFWVNPFGRKPFGDRPFDRRNGTEEGSPRRDGHPHPHGNRGRWGENESEEKEHPTTESVTTFSPLKVIEIAINEVDTNVVAEV